MIVNMIFDKTRYLALMPVNKNSHNSDMAQLPLAISGKPYTKMGTRFCSGAAIQLVMKSK